jgi:hypothetical protein
VYAHWLGDGTRKGWYLWVDEQPAAKSLYTGTRSLWREMNAKFTEEYLEGIVASDVSFQNFLHTTSDNPNTI